MDVKILNWNVNGIRAILNKGFEDFLHCLNSDLICLQEVKCNDESLLTEIFDRVGYHFKASFAEKKGYSGTLLAWKKTSQFNLHIFESCFLEPTPSPTNLDEVFKLEGRTVLAALNDFYLMNLYIPSGSSSEDRQIIKYSTMDNLYGYLGSLEASQRAKLILCGDFNICHEEEDIHHAKEATRRQLSGFLPPEREWFSSLLKLGFVDVFRAFNPTLREYTWWSYRANSRQKNLGWRLDYFLVGKEVFKHIKYVKQHTEICGSDHCPVEIMLNLS